MTTKAADILVPFMNQYRNAVTSFQERQIAEEAAATILAQSAHVRRTLPNRRVGVTFKFEHLTDGGAQKFHVTIGFYPDGTPGELFINTHKAGGEYNTFVSDAAVAISLALQHGCPLDVIRTSMKRNPNGSPMGLLSHLLDRMKEEGDSYLKARRIGE